MPKQERKLWAGLAVFTGTVASGLGYLYVHVQHPTSVPLRPGKMARSVLAAPKDAKNLSRESEEDFSNAMARLNTAFQARSGGDAERLVATVNARGASQEARPCPFEWRNGEAALSLQTDSQGKLALAKTINACADSIERLP